MNHDISSLAARGACPTLDHPMPVADGLLARFRPETGLTSEQLAALAEAAELCGNGLIEITARGNIQVRGLSDASAPDFRAALGDAAIVAQSAPAIEYSPLAGQDPKATADPRPLARRLRAVCDEALAEGALSPKLSIVLVTGGQVLLDGLKADIRLVARDDAWALELGGIALGLLEEGDVPDAVAVIFRALQAEGPRARGAELDAGHVAEKLPSLRSLDHIGVRPVGATMGPLSLSGGAAGLRIGLPFGQVRSWQIKDLARLMDRHSVAEAIPAPDRTLVLLGLSADALHELSPALAAISFGTRPDAAERRLSICSGAERGPDGVIQAAELAQALYTADPELVDGSFHIHVSTCAKGCPHAGRPGVVLAGNQLRLYRAPDAKPLATFDPAAIETGVVSLARRIRDTRRSGETTLMVLDRLGHQ